MVDGACQLAWTLMPGLTSCACFFLRADWSLIARTQLSPAVCLRESRTAVVLEVVELLLLDLPVLGLSVLLCASGYRCIPLLRDLAAVLPAAADKASSQGREAGPVPAEPPASTQASPQPDPTRTQRQVTGAHDNVLATCTPLLRRVVVAHLILLLLDIATLVATVLLVVTVYRLRRTLLKIFGYVNVKGRTDKHWSHRALSCRLWPADVVGPSLHEHPIAVACSQMTSGPLRTQTPRRWNLFVLKRASKVLADIPLAVLCCVAIACPWKWPLLYREWRWLRLLRKPLVRQEVTTQQEYSAILLSQESPGPMLTLLSPVLYQATFGERILSSNDGAYFFAKPVYSAKC
jgi:hypothetical protein